MALGKCEDCGKDVSTEAPACPHCGRPQTKPVETITPPVDPAAGIEWEPSAKNVSDSKAPIFFVIAAACLVLSLGVPRILLTMPVLIVVVCALVSIFRKEKLRVLSGIVLALAALLFYVNTVDMQRSLSGLGSGGSGAPFGTADLDKATVSDMNWRVDRSFGSRGTIKWNVRVRNLSDKPMSMVGVQFTTFDKDKKMVATTTTYVTAIPPGEERSDDSFADLYGSEETAKAVISSVHFASQ
jgi:hypothetical protein